MKRQLGKETRLHLRLSLLVLTLMGTASTGNAQGYFGQAAWQLRAASLGSLAWRSRFGNSPLLDSVYNRQFNSWGRLIRQDERIDAQLREDITLERGGLISPYGYYPTNYGYYPSTYGYGAYRSAFGYGYGTYGTYPYSSPYGSYQYQYTPYGVTATTPTVGAFVSPTPAATPVPAALIDEVVDLRRLEWRAWH